MKKFLKIFAAFLATILFLSSCFNSSNSPDAKENIAQDVFENHTQNISSPQKNMLIEYPKMKNGENKASFVNEAITAVVDDFINQWDESLLEGELSVELKYKITYYSQDFLSIVFYGYGNCTTAAHPIYDTFTLNLDLLNEKKVSLSQVVEINDNFKADFREAVDKIEYTDIADEILSYDMETFLKSVDIESSTTYSYFSEDEITIIVHFPYVVNDRVEIVIKKAETFGNVLSSENDS